MREPPEKVLKADGPRRITDAFLPAVRISHPAHIRKIAARTISQARRGELSSRTCEAIARLLKVALEALQTEVSAEKLGGGQYNVRRIIEVSPVAPEAADHANESTPPQAPASSPPGCSA